MKKLAILLLLASFVGSELMAQDANTESKTEIHYLSGKGKDDMVTWKFFCTDGRKSGEWSTIGVPSCWELQGFGSYEYGHVNFETRVNESGLYEHSRITPLMRTPARLC